jgi:hypothetical protein
MTLRAGFECSCCGEWHDGFPMDLAFDEPHYVAEVPIAERSARVIELGDFRVLQQDDATHYFIRGVLEIPLANSDDLFCYGVWASLSEKSFELARAAYAANEEAGPFFGWFSNRLPGYPETLGLKTHVHVRAKVRAAIELEPTDHPLSLEQRNGIDLARVQAIVEGALHPSPSSMQH